MGRAKEPTITTVTKIADALEVSIDELVDRNSSSRRGYLLGATSERKR